jgi:hypothetical protein
MGNMVKYVITYHIMVSPFLAADLRRSSMPLAPRVGPTWSRRPTKMDITWKSREFGLCEMRYNIYIYTEVIYIYKSHICIYRYMHILIDMSIIWYYLLFRTYEYPKTWNFKGGCLRLRRTGRSSGQFRGPT